MGRSDVAGARVRWWVLGAFSSSPTGRRFTVTADTLPEELARAASGLRVTVPDRLGAGETRTVEVSFPKLRCFQVSEVAQAVPELKALRALAETLDERTPESAVASLESVVGPGRLSAAVVEPLRAATAAKQEAGAEATEQGAGAETEKREDAVDALFARVGEARTEERARAGVSAFLKAVGGRGGKGGGVKRETVASARAVVEEAVWETARAVLAAAEVARLESAWRGLKLLMEQCPASSGMRVEVLDVARGGEVEACEAALPEERFERPDALLLVGGAEGVERLRELAGLGERVQVPVLAEVGPGLPEAWGELVEREGGGRGLRVAAVVGRELAGAPLELGFTLPLR